MNLLDSNLYRGDLKKTLQNLDLNLLKGKRILITGGLGLIGSSVVDLLIQANQDLHLGVHIFLAARKYTKFEKRYGGVSNVEFVQYDALKKIKFDFVLDYVIHCASPASPELYTNKPVETMLANIKGIENLLIYAKRKNIKRVLYVSSSEVYGRKSSEFSFIEGVYGSINIDSLRSSYPVSKQASELLCKAFCNEYGVDSVIVRPGHIFGPTAAEIDKKISSDFAYKAAKGMPLVMKSSGMQKRSYCYSVDAAAAILTVLLNGKCGEAYNIGTDEAMTIREMAEIYAQVGNVSLSYQEPTKEELKVFNPMNNSSLNCRKIKEIGFRNAFSAKEGLGHTVMILRKIIKSV